MLKCISRFRGRLVLSILLMMPVLAMAVPVAAQAPTRLALVIGNAGYAGMDKLKNPYADAKLTAQSLRQLGFEVTLLVDRTASQLEQDVQAFAQAARKADVALFFYAGHGIAVENINYLIPVDWSMASLSSSQLKSQGASLRWIEAQLRGSGATVSVMVIDACRNPLLRGAGHQGMAQMRPAKGVLTFFSTAPGARAEDGRGNNSTFSEALNRYLPRTDLSLKEVLEFTQQDVTTETGSTQIPWISSGLVGDIKLGSSEKQVAAPTALNSNAGLVKRGAPQTETERVHFWNENLASLEEDLMHAVKTFDIGSLPLLEKRAAAGDVIALTTLGMVYADQGSRALSSKRSAIGLQGDGPQGQEKLQPNSEKSVRYLKEAADKRFPVAQTLLAELLIKDKASYSSAESLLEDAAKAGYAKAKTDLASIKDDVHEIRKALVPEDARGKLQRMGYQLDVDSKVRAISSCDLEALKLYAALGELMPDAEPIWGIPAWSVLERPIRAGHPKLPEVIELLAAQGMKFNQGYALSYATTQPDLIPAQPALIERMPQELRFQFYGQSLRVTPLALALWFKNEPAVRALMKYSDVEASGVRVVVRNLERGIPTGPEFALPLVSARQEAERMGLTAWLQTR